MGLFSKPDTHSVLLIDIASASVGIGLSGITEGALPELAFSARVPFAYREEFDLAHLEHAMIFALREALGVAHREGPRLLAQRGYPGSINHAVISFSSPWYASALGSDHAGFRSALEERFSSPAEVFEMQDGLMSAAERRLVKKIEEEVIRAFGIREGIGLSSFTFSLSRVARHAFADLEPALFADMTGHMTDMLGFSSGHYSKSLSVPVGTHALKREAGIPWAEFWQKLSSEHAQGFERGNVFLVADDYDLARTHLASMLPEARIIAFGARGGFVGEMVKARDSLAPIERLAILAAYSNLFL
jgi:hypothetical protein